MPAPDEKDFRPGLFILWPVRGKRKPATGWKHSGRWLAWD